jgi:hypothetical protein
VSRFCRHNRLTVQCPICSREAVVEPPPRSAPAPSRTRRARRRQEAAPAKPSRGPFVSVGPYEGGHEIRLERVPGGLRLAAWQAGRIARRAPVVATADLPALLAEATAKDLLAAPGVTSPRPGALSDAEYGASPGRSGELRDELRVERLDDARVRVARWILRPNAGWQLQEAPVMLPPARFAAAFEAAVRKGVLVSDRAL